MGVRIIQGDCREVLKTLPDQSVHCVVTSPPYWGLRDYGVAGQMGLEPSPDDYVRGMVEVFADVKRVLRDDGTLWLNLGDSYAGPGGGGQGANGAMATRTVSKVRANIVPDKLGQGLKPKDLCGIPWSVAFALRADGWYLRQDLIWAKPNPMPESVRDRCTKSHEYIFLLAKQERYHYDADAIAEPVSQAMLDQIEQGYEGKATKDYAAGGAQDASATKARVIDSAKQRMADKLVSAKPMGLHRDEARAQGLYGQEFGLTRNRRSVWTVTTKPFSEAHFATFPPDLIEPCILAGCPKDGTVLDCFGGAGTTGLVADRLQRNAILIELNPEYAQMARERITKDAGMFAEVA